MRNTTAAGMITEEMIALYNKEQSQLLSRFFKTGKGEYGEGDRFLGIKVPVTRSLVGKYRDDVTIADIDSLISSEWHEIRLAGFLLLVNMYQRAVKRKDYDEGRKILDYYLSNLGKGNNWDLVDLVSDKILGDWVLRFPEDEKIMEELSDKDGMLWHQRVSIVSTLTLIRNGRYGMTFKIAEKFISHQHDLIHKATGWMLREIGKRGGKEELVDFLNRNKDRMPRTALRYAIERFTEEERKHFMSK